MDKVLLHKKACLGIEHLLLTIFLNLTYVPTWAISTHTNIDRGYYEIEIATVNEEDSTVNIQKSKQFTIYFPVSQYTIQPHFADNASALEKLGIFIKRCMQDSALTIESIDVSSSCSVEGNASFNQKLSQERLQCLLKYMITQYPSLKNYPIKTSSRGANWSELEDLIQQSGWKDSQEILQLVFNNSDDEQRLQELKTMDNGIPYRNILEYIYPKLRSGNISIDYDSLVVEKRRPCYLFPEVNVYEYVEKPSVFVEELITPNVWERKPLFALKTNLLLDAVTALNVEIEVPIRHHWSIAGEWIFPWWVHERDKPNDKPWRLEVLCGTIEGRYWFGRNPERPVLNGWFAGVYSSAGLYDVQWKAKGYQGEFFVAAGVSGGFAHKIGRNLSMEYSLGVGYMRTHYRQYKAIYGADDVWHPIREKRGRYTWVGPTRIKVSLVWLLQYKSKRGGRQ